MADDCLDNLLKRLNYFVPEFPPSIYKFAKQVPRRNEQGLYFVTYDCPEGHGPLDEERKCTQDGCPFQIKGDYMKNHGYVTYDIGVQLQALLDGE